jgi:hypothetical protein
MHTTCIHKIVFGNLALQLKLHIFIKTSLRFIKISLRFHLVYTFHSRFYKASKQGTEAAKDNEAKFNLKKYFSHVFNGVDMLYQTIDDPDFSLSVAVSGFIIADVRQYYDNLIKVRM